MVVCLGSVIHQEIYVMGDSEAQRPSLSISQNQKMTSSQFRLIENCIGITGMPCLVFFRISLFVSQLRNFDGPSSFLSVDIQDGISVNFHIPPGGCEGSALTFGNFAGYGSQQYKRQVYDKRQVYVL